jgi:DNA-binding PadR family transcriptional regulator
MPRRNRNNPLALAVLICLYERPMHPYEVASTLRQRHKDESVRLNYGSLYAVVSSLERRGLIVAQDTEREGRLPERTIYGLTDAGRLEAHDWLAELLAIPVKEYPALGAALSFLPALPPAEAVALLEQRAERLELALAQARATVELVEQHGLPRLLWVEVEFELELRGRELEFVRMLVDEISSGALEGLDWWRAIHSGAAPEDPPPPPIGVVHAEPTTRNGGRA